MNEPVKLLNDTAFGNEQTQTFGFCKTERFYHDDVIDIHKIVLSNVVEKNGWNDAGSPLDAEIKELVQLMHFSIKQSIL